MWKPTALAVSVGFALWLGGCVENSTGTAPDSTSPVVQGESPASDPNAASLPDTTAATDPNPADPATDPAIDTTIVPGERVGLITAETRYGDLVEWYGAEALSNENVYIGEGFSEPGTRIDLGAERSLSIIWTNPERTGVAEVRRLGSAWQTPEGIHIGMSFEELKDVLGEFQMYGFGWDYGGTVSLTDSNLATYDGMLILRLLPDPTKQESDAYGAVLGDELYESSNPNFAQLDMTIDEMIVYFAAP